MKIDIHCDVLLQSQTVTLSELLYGNFYTGLRNTLTDPKQRERLAHCFLEIALHANPETLSVLENLTRHSPIKPNLVFEKVFIKKITPKVAIRRKEFLRRCGCSEIPDRLTFKSLLAKGPWFSQFGSQRDTRLVIDVCIPHHCTKCGTLEPYESHKEEAVDTLDVQLEGGTEPEAFAARAGLDLAEGTFRLVSLLIVPSVVLMKGKITKRKAVALLESFPLTKPKASWRDPQKALLKAEEQIPFDLTRALKDFKASFDLHFVAEGINLGIITALLGQSAVTGVPASAALIGDVRATQTLLKSLASRTGVRCALVDVRTGASEQNLRGAIKILSGAPYALLITLLPLNLPAGLATRFHELNRGKFATLDIDESSALAVVHLVEPGTPTAFVSVEEQLNDEHARVASEFVATNETLTRRSRGILRQRVSLLGRAAAPQEASIQLDDIYFCYEGLVALVVAGSAETNSDVEIMQHFMNRKALSKIAFMLTRARANNLDGQIALRVLETLVDPSMDLDREAVQRMDVTS